MKAKCQAGFVLAAFLLCIPFRADAYVLWGEYGSRGVYSSENDTYPKHTPVYGSYLDEVGQPITFGESSFSWISKYDSQCEYFVVDYYDSHLLDSGGPYLQHSTINGNLESVDMGCNGSSSNWWADYHYCALGRSHTNLYMYDLKFIINDDQYSLDYDTRYWIRIKCNVTYPVKGKYLANKFLFRTPPERTESENLVFLATSDIYDYAALGSFDYEGTLDRYCPGAVWDEMIDFSNSQGQSVEFMLVPGDISNIDTYHYGDKKFRVYREYYRQAAESIYHIPTVELAGNHDACWRNVNYQKAFYYHSSDLHNFIPTPDHCEICWDDPEDCGYWILYCRTDCIPSGSGLCPGCGAYIAEAECGDCTGPIDCPDSRFYSFNWGDIHFVGTDIMWDHGPYDSQHTSDPVYSFSGMGSRLMRWLVDDLGRYYDESRYIIEFRHTPLSSSDYSHSDTGSVYYDYASTIRKNNVDLAVVGHNHVVAKTQARLPSIVGSGNTATQYLPEFIVGGGGAGNTREYGDCTNAGFAAFNVGTNSIVVKLVDVTKNEFGSYHQLRECYKYTRTNTCGSGWGLDCLSRSNILQTASSSTCENWWSNN